MKFIVSSAIAAFAVASTSANGSIHPATVSPALRALQTIGGPLYRDGGPRPCSAAFEGVSSGTWTAPQIATAYGIDGLYRSSDFGQGVTIAVVAYGPVPTRAISTFDRCYGVTTRPQLVNVYSGVGGAAAGTPGSTVTGWGSQLEQDETAVDVETISVLAPKATIVLYDDPSGTEPVDSIISMIVAAGNADVINDSYLGCESPGAAALEEPLFRQATAQGATVLAASGDSGAYSCSTEPEQPNVDDPASDPLVTSVGGTSLKAPYPDREAAWSDSGGGISEDFAMPTYQLQAAGFLGVVGVESSGQPCGASPGHFCREVPDVSALAGTSGGTPGGLEAVLPLLSGSTAWNPASGTSLSAPVWSAIVADLDSAPGCGQLGNINPALYAAASREYRSAFHDVTTGSTFAGQRPSQGIGANGITVGTNPLGYRATKGYDLATGLGTPRLFAPHARGLAAALCPGSRFTPSP